ncbi:MAG: formate dehydrogenase accessory sulfurtransferase FdhD [Acidithiobacillus sp.]
MNREPEIGGVIWSSARCLDKEVDFGVHREAILEECAVSIVINGAVYGVMMLTPQDLEDFVLGFLWTEHVLHSPEDIVACEREQSADGQALYLQLRTEAAMRADARRRCLPGGSACGLCGVPNFSGLQPFPPIRDGGRISCTLIEQSLARLCAEQQLNHHTGTAHAAGIGTEDAIIVREDIGRHNAVDKAIGAALRCGWSGGDARLLTVSSRLSFEIALKALSFGIPTVVAVSGVSSLAIQLAERCGLTLIGYARDGRLTIYANAWRILRSASLRAEPPGPSFDLEIPRCAGD